jgi:hypothetical protein
MEKQRERMMCGAGPIKKIKPKLTTVQILIQCKSCLPKLQKFGEKYRAVRFRVKNNFCRCEGVFLFYFEFD